MAENYFGTTFKDQSVRWRWGMYMRVLWKSLISTIKVLKGFEYQKCYFWKFCFLCSQDEKFLDTSKVELWILKSLLGSILVPILQSSYSSPALKICFIIWSLYYIPLILGSWLLGPESWVLGPGCWIPCSSNEYSKLN